MGSPIKTHAALAADPKNPMALMNLGASSASRETACGLSTTRQCSFEIDPQDPQTVYGLAFAYMEQEAPEDLRPLPWPGTGLERLRPASSRLEPQSIEIYEKQLMSSVGSSEPLERPMTDQGSINCLKR